ncbi:MAG: amino acid ABC transporter permease [Chloroflexi bacterium]|nr:amino acid ABC transporter permease [Chloroflexota bacterium]
MGYQFEWQAAIDSIPVILTGLSATLAVTITVFLVSLPFAIAVMLARLSRFRFLRVIAYAYTELFRTLPLLIVLTWFYFVPAIGFGIRMSPFLVAVVAFTLTFTAFLTEALRGALMAIDPGQREAAMSVGMTSPQVYRRVLIPQALRYATPVIATMWVSLFRDSALVALVGVHDMLFEARTLAVVNYRPIEVLTMTGIIYFALTYPQSVMIERIFAKRRVRS